MNTQNAVDNYIPGAIIQTQSVNTVGSSTTSTTFVDITGATVTITPKSTTSKILIIASASFDSSLITNKATTLNFQCLRGVTVIGGSPYSTVGAVDNNPAGMISDCIGGFVFVDSPATTSATTYKFQQEIAQSNGQTVTTANMDIVVMEIAAASYSANYVVVGGGGGGGGCIAAGGGGAGGGGAGGFVTGTLFLTVGTSYTITIGGGGAGGTTAPTRGSNGSNSVFGPINANGGGGGGFGTNTVSGSNGIDGANGGGGGGSDGGTGSTGGHGPSPGHNGGIGLSNANRTAGGGGGSGAVGADATAGAGGNGGAGTSTSISGSPVTYAGGGGGGANGGSAGTGANGGGNGGLGNNVGANATANTGSGGGGSGNARAGGNGGSGIVIISIPTRNYSGITTGAPTVTTSGSNTILTYNASGTYTA